MRELKFKVWNIEDKIWDNPSILEVWNAEGKLEPFSYIKTGKLNPVYMPVENYIIQQFTGLKDRNNREIYEGDICEETLHGHTIIGAVCFEDYRWMLINNDNDVVYFNDILDIKIIGNIFENPEFLK